MAPDSALMKGVQIVVLPDLPKLQLRDRFLTTKYGDTIEWISKEDWNKTNEWLIQFLGHSPNLIKDKEYWVTGSSRVFMNPRTFELLKAVMK